MKDIIAMAAAIREAGLKHRALQKRASDAHATWVSLHDEAVQASRDVEKLENALLAMLNPIEQ